MELEAQTLKRDRPRDAVVPRRKKQAALDPAEEKRRAREYAELVAAYVKSLEEAKDEPPPDLSAIEAAEFRESWNRLWSDTLGDFEATTKIPPMRFTDNPAPPYTAFRCDTLQIFSVKVTGVRGGLQWPLHVFGTVALRDAVDRRRNIIFNRKRDSFQTLTQEKPYLKLTGPTRAVVMLQPVTFEVELSVKGAIESEDKDLSYLAEPLVHQAPLKSSVLITEYTSKLSTIEFTHGHICESVEATIRVQMINGSWQGYRSEVFVCTGSTGEEVLLLDSGDEEVPVTADSTIELSRRVVSVEHKGKLMVFVKAWRGNHLVNLQAKGFTPKGSGRSHSMLDFGFCKMKVTVAWSLVTFNYNLASSL